MILEEYAEQIATTGHIQTLKMVACKSMFRAIWAFCSFVFILGVLSLWCYVSSQMSARQKVSETKPAERVSGI